MRIFSCIVASFPKSFPFNPSQYQLSIIKSYLTDCSFPLRCKNLSFYLPLKGLSSIIEFEKGLQRRTTICEWLHLVLDHFSYLQHRFQKRTQRIYHQFPRPQKSKFANYYYISEEFQFTPISSSRSTNNCEAGFPSTRFLTITSLGPHLNTFIFIQVLKLQIDSALKIK